MMKKMYVVFLFILALSLVGCAAGGNTAETEDFLDVMETAGYSFEQRDADSMAYYETNSINTKYDLDVEVVDLYVGYVNSNERWAEVVVLKTEAQATAFKDALAIEATEGRIVVQDGAIILITYSQETANLFSNKE